MLHGDLSPPKTLMYPAFPCSGDFWTLRKRPQSAENFMRDSGTCWLSPRHSRQISGMFWTNFMDVFGRFNGFSGQISGMFSEGFKDKLSI